MLVVFAGRASIFADEITEIFNDVYRKAKEGHT
jgi:hypothetical protein